MELCCWHSFHVSKILCNIFTEVLHFCINYHCNRPGRKRGFLGYRGYHGFFFSNFYKSVFSIFTNSEYRKLGFQKIRDFQTSMFSIFTIGEYRKHGCLRTSDFLKSEFSIFTRQMLEIRDFQTSAFSIFAIGEYRKHGFSNIRVFDIRYRWISKTRMLEISDFWNPSFRQMFENLGFLKSKFSIFTIGEYRKHGFIKVGEKNPRYPWYPRHPRFRSCPL